MRAQATRFYEPVQAPEAVCPAAVTEQEIEAAWTPAGGWTRQQLAAWGLPWPPPRGWKDELLRRRAYSPELVALAEQVAADLAEFTD